MATIQLTINDIVRNGLIVDPSSTYQTVNQNLDTVFFDNASRRVFLHAKNQQANTLILHIKPGTKLDRSRIGFTDLEVSVPGSGERFIGPLSSFFVRSENSLYIDEAVEFNIHDTQLITNPSFEDVGITGWTQTGTATTKLYLMNIYRHTFWGSKAYAALIARTAAATQTLSLESSFFNAVQGTIIDVEAWLRQLTWWRSSTGQYDTHRADICFYNLAVSWYTSGDAYISSDVGTTFYLPSPSDWGYPRTDDNPEQLHLRRRPPYREWTRATHTTSGAPATTAKAKVEIRASNVGSPADNYHTWLWVDNVSAYEELAGGMKIMAFKLPLP